jgi:hypothetical protein
MMISYRPKWNADHGRVIQFRPRIGMPRGSRSGNAPIDHDDPDHSPVPDLAKYECPESDDEYRHRMTVNAAAAAFTSVLIFAGVWLANMMAHA